MPKPRSKSFYEKTGNQIWQRIHNLYPSSSHWKAGSRAEGTNRRGSDLDYQFRITGKGKRHREEVYERIRENLGPSFRLSDGEKVNVRVGGDKNVINFQPEHGGKISFALMD